jgi:hypothetical protein
MATMDNQGMERRQQERIARKIPFYCYVDGQRFDSETLNISASGAFLQTDDTIALKAPVLLLPKTARESKPALLVVGHVARHQQEPVRGVGIVWRKAVSRRGLSLIIKLASLLPEMFPDELPPPSREIMGLDIVGYDFGSKAYFEPALPKAGSKSKKMDVGKARSIYTAATREAQARSDDEHAPPEQRSGNLTRTRQEIKTLTSYGTVGGDPYSPIPEGARCGAASLDTLPHPPEPPDAATTQRLLDPAPARSLSGSGPVTDVLGYRETMIPVEFPVVVKRGRKKVDGHLLQVGMGNCFVAVPGIDPADCTPFEPVAVHFPIVLNKRQHEVVLAGQLLAISEDPRTGREGLSMTIRFVTQPSYPGLYERYVKYLYYNMIKDA